MLGGGTEKRYTINGVVDTSKQPAEILNDLLTSCGGSIYYSNEKWHIKVGAFITPSVTLTNDDLRGSIRLQTRNAGRDQFNAVKGIFVSPENNHQPTDFPEVKSTTFETEDGGDRKYLDLVLPYTTSVSSAQRLAKQILYRNREQIVITMPCKLTAFQFEVGDTFRYTNERLGFNQKIFEVISWTFAFEGEELGVELVAKETSTAIYQWDSAVDEQAFTFNNTTLPDAFDLAPVTLIASDELRVLNQEAISVLVVNVSSAETFATRFEVEAKKTSDTDFVNMGQASGNRFELLNVEDGITYDIRARIISTLGIRSQFATATHQVVGKTAPPQDVTDFAVNIIGTEAHLSWTPVTDADLSHYVIRHSPLTTGAEYANSRTIADKLSRPANTAVVPALTGTYFIKAVDKLDLASTNPTASVAIIEEIKGFNLVETSTQHPAFTGSKTEVVAVDNELILDTSIDFDDVTGNFDDANGSFDGGGGTVSTSGTYEFDNYIDLTAVYTSHVTASVSVTRRDYVNLFDDAVGLFDARTGTFDGDVQAFDDTDVEVQVSTTDDDPAGSPTWSNYRRFIVGDYKARALRFRAILTSGDGEATPVVSQLSVTVDMPDRSVAEADIASGAGAKVITFSPAFKALQGVGIAAQNLQSGDYYNVTSKTATGFTITFYNSSNTAVDRTFDYVAKGYGEVAA